MSCIGICLSSTQQEIPQPWIIKIDLKITYLRFKATFPGANELMCNIGNDTSNGANGQATAKNKCTEQSEATDVQADKLKEMLRN